MKPLDREWCNYSQFIQIKNPIKSVQVTYYLYKHANKLNECMQKHNGKHTRVTTNMQ